MAYIDGNVIQEYDDILEQIKSLDGDINNEREIVELFERLIVRLDVMIEGFDYENNELEEAIEKARKYTNNFVGDADIDPEKFEKTQNDLLLRHFALAEAMQKFLDKEPITEYGF